MKKFCFTCNDEKPLIDFYTNTKSKDGHRASCKECENKKRRQRREQGLEWEQRIRQAAIDKLGGCCVRCGFSDPRALQIDHKNGGGCKERTLLGSNRLIFKKIVDGQIEEYQLLCANCNWIKRVENYEVGPYTKNVVL